MSQMLPFHRLGLPPRPQFHEEIDCEEEDQEEENNNNDFCCPGILIFFSLHRLNGLEKHSSPSVDIKRRDLFELLVARLEIHIRLLNVIVNPVKNGALVNDHGI